MNPLVIYRFENGNIAVFDRDEQQVSRLQKRGRSRLWQWIRIAFWAWRH